MDKCECGRERKRNKVNFQHRKFTFNFEPYCPLLVCPQCAKQYALELFERYYRELLVKKEEDFEINWEFYENANEVAKEEMVKLLVMINLLSFDMSGRWAIIGERMILNLGQGSAYFFTRKQDVVSYAKLKFGGAMYHWVIVKFETLLKKAEVLKKK